MKKWFVVLLAFLLNFSHLEAKDFASEVSKINSAAFPKIEVLMKVFTKQPQEMLKDSFVVNEDQTPILDFAFASVKNRHYMILVIDRSSSIEPAMNSVKRAAADFVNSMVSDVQISLLSFGSDLDFNHRFSCDADSLNKAIFKIRPWGGTALYDAIYAACEELNNEAGRNDLKTIVCITDGRDSKPNGQTPLSTHTPQQVIGFAESKGIRIISVGLGNDIDEEILKGFAASTRGWYLKSTSPEQLGKLYAAMSRRMKLEKYYRLSYTSPRPEYDGNIRKVEIISQNKGKKDQGSGTYTAPARTTNAVKETEGRGSSRSRSRRSVSNHLELHGPDSPYLTSPIILPPASPVHGPNRSRFLRKSPEESQAIIEEARNRMASEHEQNYQRAVNYLNDYLNNLDSLEKENDASSKSPDLKDFERARIEYRYSYLQSRREEINLYQQRAYDRYRISLQKSIDEMDYAYRIYVQGEPWDDEFHARNSASATAALEIMKQQFDAKIDQCRQKRLELRVDTNDARNRTAEHSTHSETYETIEVSQPQILEGPGHSIKELKNYIDKKLPESDNLDPDIPKLDEIDTIE